MSDIKYWEHGEQVHYTFVFDQGVMSVNDWTEHVSCFNCASNHGLTIELTGDKWYDFCLDCKAAYHMIAVYEDDQATAADAKSLPEVSDPIVQAALRAITQDRAQQKQHAIELAKQEASPESIWILLGNMPAGKFTVQWVVDTLNVSELDVLSVVSVRDDFVHLGDGWYCQRIDDYGLAADESDLFDEEESDPTYPEEWQDEGDELEGDELEGDYWDKERCVQCQEVIHGQNFDGLCEACYEYYVKRDMNDDEPGDDEPGDKLEGNE